MVHALRPSLHFAARLHPDARRVAGLALAISLNVALLMLLLVPMQGTPPQSPPDAAPALTWILPRPKAPPPPPVHMPVTAHHAVPRPSVPVPMPSIPDPGPVVVDQADSSILVGADEGTEDLRSTQGDAVEPLPGVTLEYLDAPPPAYPRDALREGVEGVVMLQVLVDADGRPMRVDIQRSSGDRRLDNAARKQVLQHWRFRAAMKNGQAVQAIGLVPIAFSLR